MTDFAAVDRLLDELAPVVHEEPEAWADVLARAELLAAGLNGRVDGRQLARLRPRLRPRRAARRRLLVLAAAALALVIVAAAAYALSRTVVDFGSAPRAPEKVVVDFGRTDLGAPPGMATNVLPHETRRISSVTIDGQEHVLWVAPTAQGGFCELWWELVGGCRAKREGGLDVSVESTATGTGVAVLEGSFFDGAGERLEASFADGTSDEIPFVWVTAPINAGFFIYRVPDANRLHERRPVSLTLLDGSGNVLLQTSVIDVAAHAPPPPNGVERRLPGLGPVSVGPWAEWSKRRRLFDWRVEGGRHLALWVAPERSGATCMWAGGKNTLLESCTPAGGRAAPMASLGLYGATTVMLCCEVGRAVARIEADFQDGDRVELAPKEGYLLWPIPSRHDAPGSRLARLVAYDVAGRVLARRRMPTGAALYACATRKPTEGRVNMSVTAVAIESRTRPPSSPPRVAVRALGIFRVLRGNETVSSTEWQSKKARDLLKILVARRGRPTTREALMETLWPEQDPRRTANRLSVALSTARFVLDPGHRFGPDRFICADRSAVRLDLESVACDVERFLHLAREGLARRAGSRAGAAELLQAAHEVYTGDFLEEDLYEDWAVSLREEARAAYLAVECSLGELADARGDRETAISYRLHVLEHDPYDERAHLTIVTVLEAAGRHGQARRAYDRYRARMREIGVEPAPYPGAITTRADGGRARLQLNTGPL